MAEPQKKQLAAEWFSADRPIVSASEDKLGRTRFAQAIAEAVSGWTGRDSLVIGVCGPWGSGKSSIKNMVKEAVEAGHGGAAIVAEFNPWRFADASALTENFFDQLGIALGRGSDEKRKETIRKLRRYAAYFRASGRLIDLGGKPLTGPLLVVAILVATSALPGLRWLALIVAGIIAVLAAVLHLSSKAAEYITDFLEVRVGTERKSLEELKRGLAEGLRTRKYPLLVIMDNVNRLSPQEVQAVFQIVKVNADFPNLVYLLLFDRAIVAKAVEKTVQVDGADYIEKIVQVCFDVPAIEHPRLVKVLSDGLNALLDSPSVRARFDKHRWENLFIGGLQPYFQTLRQVKRFLSTLSVHVSLLQGEESFEVNPVNLIALEVLRVFEPDVYRALSQSKEVLIRNRDYPVIGNQEEAAAAIRRLAERASGGRRAQVEEIIKQLFPTAEWAFGGATDGGERPIEAWYRNLRVCSPDVFDRYFHLAIPQGDLSQSQIERLLAKTGDREAFRAELRELATEGLLEVAIDRLGAYKETVPVEHAGPFASALFDIGDYLSEEQGELFSLAPMMHAVRILHRYLKRQTDRQEVARILGDAIRSTDGLGLPVTFVSLHEPRNGRDTDEGARIVDDGSLQELKSLCVERIEAHATDGRLADNPHLCNILWRWRDWAGPEPAREFGARLAQTPEGALKLAGAFVTHAVSSGLGDYVQSSHSFIGLGSIEAFVPWEQVARALEGLETTGLSEQQQEALQAFRKAVARRKEGKADWGATLGDDLDE